MEKDYKKELQNLFEIVATTIGKKAIGISDNHVCLFMKDAEALLKVLTDLQLNGYVQPRKGKKEDALDLQAGKICS